METLHENISDISGNKNKSIRPYFTIRNRSSTDRMGANIFSYINQIMLAHHFNYYININKIRYEDSIFVKTIIDYIQKYNSDKIMGNEITIQDIAENKCFIDVNYSFHLSGFFTCITKMDLFTYFKKYIYSDFIKIFEQYSKDWIINFDPKKTILVHVRLDDLNHTNSFDYDGDIISKYFIDRINNDYFFSFQSLYELTGKSFFKYIIKHKHQLNIDELKSVDKRLRDNMLYLFGYQSVIKEKRISEVIDKLLIKYPNHEVVIVSSPHSDIGLPYRRIHSDDPNYDLFCLTQCDKIVLSRSTFALSSVFFSNAKEVWIPQWSMTSCCGLNTKYDSTNFYYY